MVDLQTLLRADSQLKWQSGPQEMNLTKVVLPEQAGPGLLSYAFTLEWAQTALSRMAGALVVPASLVASLSESQGTALLVTSDIKHTMALTLKLFDQKQMRFSSAPSTPVAVAATARVSPSAWIGAFAVIGENVSIGANSVIGSHTVIERDSQIGEHCVIHPQVFVGAQTQIGDRCEIHPHTTLGSDGFGYATDRKFRHHKISQLGHVEIEDDVEIGAGCAIDRGALGPTRIRRGTKIDNLSHIAHNVEVGEDTLLAAGFMVAGSTTIGSRNMYGGSCVVTDHVHVGDDVIVGGRSTITNDVKTPGRYGGYPLQPLKSYLRNLALQTHLVDIRKDLQRALKALGLTSTDSQDS